MLDKMAAGALIAVVALGCGLFIACNAIREAAIAVGRLLARTIMGACVKLSGATDALGAARRALWARLEPYWRSVRGLALQSFAEHAPLLRSRAISGALALQIIAVAGWMLPEWARSNLVEILMVIGAGAMFARSVHGRVNASGPLVTPREAEGAMGPGAAAEMAASATVNFAAFADDQLRALVRDARAALRARAA
jgi:hypothetical protein